MFPTFSCKSLPRPDFEILKPCYGVNPSEDETERSVNAVRNVNGGKHSCLYNDFAKTLPHLYTALLALPNSILETDPLLILRDVQPTCLTDNRSTDGLLFT